MRRNFGKLLACCFMLGISTIGFAGQGFQQENLNQRIKALRTRLTEYSKQKHKKVEVKETVELKLEEISENLESRKDVEVLVLFHDPEFTEAAPIEEKAVEPIEKPVVKALTIEELRKKYSASSKKTIQRAKEIREMVARLR